MSWLNNIDRIIIITNNTCNLHCELCSTGCDRPIGSHPFRASAWEVRPEDVDLFLTRLNFRTEIRLLGGETTAMNWSSLYRIIDMIKTDGHKLSMLTNGFGLLAMEHAYLNKIDHIVLNNHGPNEEQIYACESELDYHGIEYETINHVYHNDLEESAAHPDNKGKNCDQWLRLPALYDRVLYPCCSMMQIADGVRDTWASLKRSGWSLDNPTLLEHIQDLSTLEPMIFQRCFNECYMPDIHLGSRVKVTKKPHDKMRRIK